MTETRDAAHHETSRILSRGQGASWRRRILLFITGGLLLNALVGEQGLAQTLRARREQRAAVASLAAVRNENAGLRDQIRRLQDDPAVIEAVARQDLGLIKPDEIPIVVHDSAGGR